jgi:hypothetical protein
MAMFLTCVSIHQLTGFNMKNFIFKNSHKYYITSKIAAFLYPDDFIWMHEKHLKEVTAAKNNKNEAQTLTFFELLCIIISGLFCWWLYKFPVIKNMVQKIIDLF